MAICTVRKAEGLGGGRGHKMTSRSDCVCRATAQDARAHTLNPFTRGYLSLCRFSFTAAVWCVPALRVPLVQRSFSLRDKMVKMLRGGQNWGFVFVCALWFWCVSVCGKASDMYTVQYMRYIVPPCVARARPFASHTPQHCEPPMSERHTKPSSDGYLTAPTNQALG